MNVVKAKFREHSSSSPDLTNEVSRLESIRKGKGIIDNQYSKVVNPNISHSIPRKRKQLLNPFNWEDLETKSEYSQFSEMKANRSSPVLIKSPLAGNRRSLEFKLVLGKNISDVSAQLGTTSPVKP